jgi:hypothetical protein
MILKNVQFFSKVVHLLIFTLCEEFSMVTSQIGGLAKQTNCKVTSLSRLNASEFHLVGMYER